VAESAQTESVNTHRTQGCSVQTGETFKLRRTCGMLGIGAGRKAYLCHQQNRWISSYFEVLAPHPGF